MEFRSIKQLQQFEPYREYLWDLSFSFNPFKSSANASNCGVSNLGSYIPNQVVAWVPADSMSRTLSIVNSGDLQAGQTAFRFPSGSSSLELSINFMDDYKGSIKRWLRCWQEGIILCSGNAVNYPNECVDILTIQELLPDKTVQHTDNIYVYPDGPLQEQWTSQTGIKAYSMNFVVCGKV